MFNLVCVTNRKLCQENFLSRIEAIVKCSPSAIILREKDLSEEAYKELAVKVMTLCKEYGVTCILHNFPSVAIELKAKAIHLPLPLLRSLSKEERKQFVILGASCHSVEEAKEAKLLDCTYITAGHIYATNCKKGLPPRGVQFLKEVCDSVTIPVLAIGGIDESNCRAVRSSGASGVCIMSGLMCCEDPQKYSKTIRKAGGMDEV